MIRPARVADVENMAVAAQEFGDPFGVLHLLANAQGKRLERFQKNPGIERRQAGAGLLIEGMNFVLDNLAAAEYNAAEAAAVPVDMLCCRIDDAIGPELERLLQNWCRKDIVDDEACAMFMRDASDRRNIVDFKAWIGRGFQNRSFVSGRIAARHWARSPPSTRVDATPKRGSKSSTT